MLARTAFVGSRPIVSGFRAQASGSEGRARSDGHFMDFHILSADYGIGEVFLLDDVTAIFDGAAAGTEIEGLIWLAGGEGVTVSLGRG